MNQRTVLPRLLLLALLLASAAGPSAAQSDVRIQQLVPSDTLYEMRLADGTTYVGRVESVAGDTIRVRTVSGVGVELQRGQLEAVHIARGKVVKGQFWRDDSNETRLFFAPTGRTVDAGTGYAGLFWVLPFLAYGITDAVTIAGGFPLVGGSDGGPPPFYLAPKVRVVSTPKANVSTGVLALFGADGGEEEGNSVYGVAYGVGTFGSEDNAVTVGAGLPFASRDGAADKFVVMVGGETRVSRRMKLLTENWAMPGEEGVLLTAGIRLMGERWTTDLGLAAPATGDGFFYFPIVSFAYAFGGGR